MSETFTVIYEVAGSVRPHVRQLIGEDAETDAVRFASKYEGARIRRDSDNAYYDYKSGTWVALCAN